MGVYDTITIGERTGQVKCFGCDMLNLTTGNVVAGVTESFSIAMREGGYVNIVNGAIVDWTDQPTQGRVIDKWGDPFGPESVGMLGGEYLFSRQV